MKTCHGTPLAKKKKTSKNNSTDKILYTQHITQTHHNTVHRQETDSYINKEYP